MTHPCPCPWEFNEQVTNNFEAILRRSVPNYEVMQSLIVELGCNFLRPDTGILDIGCSKGETVQRFLDKGLNNNFYLIDSSQPMIDYCNEKFKSYSNVIVKKQELTNQLTISEKNSLVLSILTIQFIEPYCRLQLIRNIFKSLDPGGAFIWIEKTCNPLTDKVFTEVYYNFKKSQGYTAQEIDEKRQSLHNVLIPWDIIKNENALHQFSYKARFWQWGPFVGWLAVK